MGKNKTMKKGDSKALAISHPNSRKAKALSKKMIKSSMRQKTKMEYSIKRNLFGEKLLWFRENIEPDEEYTAVIFDKLFQKYLSRFDEELEQIAIKHSVGQRKNRQHANREDIINMTKKRDFEEYNTCGIEMVDILNRKQLKMFREWDGELGFLNQFNIRRFSKSYLANYKPPHGKGATASVSGESEYKDEEMTVSEENQGFENDNKTSKCSASPDEDLDNSDIVIKRTIDVEMVGT